MTRQAGWKVMSSSWSALSAEPAHVPYGVTTTVPHQELHLLERHTSCPLLKPFPQAVSKTKSSGDDQPPLRELSRSDIRKCSRSARIHRFNDSSFAFRSIARPIAA